MSENGCPDCGTDAIGLPVGEHETKYPDETAFLEAVRRVTEEVLLPHAEESDRAAGPNRRNFRALAEAGVPRMAVGREWGGLDASGAAQRSAAEMLASGCGVTTFVQSQHHGPCRMIAGGQDELLKRILMPELTSGRMLCAVSFAHLRRPGPPVLRAEPVAGGYRLNGTAPWVTGWGLMNQVVFGAVLPDERFVYLWAPARTSDFPELFEGRLAPDGQPGSLSASKPLPICAMNASATVELTCSSLWVPEQHALNFSDRETMRRNDRNGVLGATAMPLGCAAGSVRHLCRLAELRGMPAVARSAERFGSELALLRQEVQETKSNTPELFAAAVQLRARVLLFALRAAQAAVAAGSGASNNLNNPAQRLLREAMFYTIQAQTREVMEATLELLETPAENAQ